MTSGSSACLATRGAQGSHKQPKRGWLWLADGSCIRLRPQHRNHVWSYDFVEDRTHDGRRYRMLNVLDEFTHECLAIRVARKLKAIDVIDVLSDLFILRGVPGYIRSDNGPEFVAQAVQDWIAAVGANTAYIDRGIMLRRLAPNGWVMNYLFGWALRARASTSKQKMKCSITVLNVSRMNKTFNKVSPFATFDPRRSLKGRAKTPFFSTLGGLCVDDRRRRTCFTSRLLARRHVEPVVDALQRAVLIPQFRIIVHRTLRRQVFGQRLPLTPCP
jgi:Integrase core domain